MTAKSAEASQAEKSALKEHQAWISEGGEVENIVDKISLTQCRIADKIKLSF